jgi:hypothetical protein
VATPFDFALIPPMVMDNRGVDKRGAPVVKETDYTKQQIQQIKEGHLDAIKLASMVVTQSKEPDTFDPIFQNYFRLSDRDTVISNQ